MGCGLSGVRAAGDLAAEVGAIGWANAQREGQAAIERAPVGAGREGREYSWPSGLCGHGMARAVLVHRTAT